MTTKRVITIICIATLTIILIPLLVDWVIVGNDLPSNISNPDWVNFLGGYIGALIGAAVSLGGIVITIRYTNEQNTKERELQVRPYCAIRYVATSKAVTTRKELGCLMLGCEPQANNGPAYRSVIYIKNIGLGPAIEFEFDVDDIDDGRKHYPILEQRTPETANNAVNLLQPGDEAIIPINIWFNFDHITDEDLENVDDPLFGEPCVKHNVMNKYKNFDISITVKYCDMYQNEYAQKITLSSNMQVTKPSGGKWRHTCDIYLKETTTPFKLGKRGSLS